MKILQKIDKFIFTFCKCIIAILFIVMIVAASLQVIFRFVLNNSLAWTEELCRFAMIWMTMLSLGLAVRMRSHISIDIIKDLVPAKVIPILDKIGCIIGIALSFVIVWTGISLAQLNMTQFSAAMHWNMGYMYCSVPVGAVILIFYLALQLFGLDKKLDELDRKGVK